MADLRTLEATVNFLASAIDRIETETKTIAKTAALADGRGDMAFRAIGLLADLLSDEQRRDLADKVAEFPVVDELAEDTDKAAAAEAGRREARSELLTILSANLR